MAAANYHESSSSSSSSRSRRCIYDVFLSFKSKDTRKTFTGHLDMALRRAGINVFKDDRGLRVGENISAKLLEAIDRSRISVIIFSADYAGSSWCLDELVNIMKCKKTVQQMVFPVFYKVKPSDVLNHDGSFNEAIFARYEDDKHFKVEKVLGWRKALNEAGNLKGLHIEDHDDEAESVQKIVEEIQKHVSNIGCLHVAQYPVGLDSHVQKLEYRSRRHHTNDVCIIGICAMGGMGKTTIAKAFYNHLLSDFEYKGFLHVRESSKNDYLHLQNKLLSKIFKNNTASSSPEGTKMIEKNLNCTKVLIVLDNVDHQDQLTNLAIRREREQFASGSIIIITTQDKHLLTLIEVDCLYCVEGLNDDKSLELFCWHAFSKSHPKEDYVGLSKDIIAYCKGLPLALTILGSLLFGRDASFWEDTLEKLKSNPNDDIHEKLKISYDALDRKQKSIFLHVACFFIGIDKDYVHPILEACELHPKSGIPTLISRSLLTINDYSNKLMMHDLLRDMGREIVRKISDDKLEKYSRLWHEEHVLKVLKMEPKGTKSVEGLILELPTSNEKPFRTEAFASMCNLKLLQLNNVKFTGSYDHFSKDLRWLCWHGFPSKLIPKNFNLENVVVLDMRFSKLREFSKEIKVLQKLKVLDLSHSKCLRKTPDFSKIPNIEKIGLKGCTRLVEVHPSIGNLHKLDNLDMTDCKELKSLPDNICMLKALKSLNLSGCSKFERLPNDMRAMEALVELLVDKTALRQVPPLKNIKYLSFQGYTGLTYRSFLYWLSTRKSPNLVNLSGLTSLEKLILRDCNLSNEVIPKDIGSLSSLRTLDLSGNNFSCLPAGISCLSMLWMLLVRDCRSLVSLPELPVNLSVLTANGCNNLLNLPAQICNLHQLEIIEVDGCTSLQSIPELPKNLSQLWAEYCPSLERFPIVSRFPLPKVLTMKIPRLEKVIASCLMDAIPQHPGHVKVQFEGNIPSQFCYQSMRPGLSLTVDGYFEDAVLDVCVSFLHHSANVDYYMREGGDKIPPDWLWLTRYGGLVLSNGDQLEIEVRPTHNYIYFRKLGVRLYDKSESGTGSIQLNGVIMPNSHSPENSMITRRGTSDRCYLFYSNEDPHFDIDINIKKEKNFHETVHHDMGRPAYKRPRL